MSQELELRISDLESLIDELKLTHNSEIPIMGKLFSALSKAQGEYPSLTCDATGQIRSGKTDKFASLDAILSPEIRKINTKYGLSIHGGESRLSDGTKIWRVVLAHESSRNLGDCIVYESPIIDATASSKLFAWGSSNTYQLRYMVKNLLGLSDKGDRENPEDDEEIKKITVEQKNNIIKLAKNDEDILGAICDEYKLKLLADLPASCYESLIKSLK